MPTWLTKTTIVSAVAVWNEDLIVGFINGEVARWSAKAGIHKCNFWPQIQIIALAAYGNTLCIWTAANEVYRYLWNTPGSSLLGEVVPSEHLRVFPCLVGINGDIILGAHSGIYHYIINSELRQDQTNFCKEPTYCLTLWHNTEGSRDKSNM